MKKKELIPKSQTQRVLAPGSKKKTKIASVKKMRYVTPVNDIIPVSEFKNAITSPVLGRLCMNNISRNQH